MIPYTILMSVCLTMGAVWFSVGISSTYFAQSSQVQNIAMKATIGIYLNETEKQVFDDAEALYDDTRLLGHILMYAGTGTLMLGILFGAFAAKQNSKI